MYLNNDLYILPNKTSFSMSTKFNTTVTNSSVSYKITTAGWYRIYMQHINSNNVGDMKILINGQQVSAAYCTRYFEVADIFLYLDINKTVTFVSTVSDSCSCYVNLIY